MAYVQGGLETSSMIKIMTENAEEKDGCFF